MECTGFTKVSLQILYRLKKETYNLDLGEENLFYRKREIKM